MNILTTAYYHDFARYFSYLEDSFKEVRPGCRFTHLCMYPSAYAYFKRHGRTARMLAVEADRTEMPGIDGIVADGRYRGFDLDEAVAYNRRTQELFGVDAGQRLKRRAVRYIEYFERLFAGGRFDLFISSGDTRMVTEMAVAVAGRYGVPVRFFEQGPFGTTMIDSDGVNCRISFVRRGALRLATDDARLDAFLDGGGGPRRTKFYREPGYRPARRHIVRDMMYMHPPFFLRRSVPVEFQTGQGPFARLVLRRLTKVKNAAQKRRGNPHALPSRFVCLILQVPVDAQMLVHSPHYAGFADMVRDVHQALPEGYRLVVREHPLNMGLYERELYRYVRAHRIPVDNRTPLERMLRNAAVVVVNNSTVGMEALAYGKTVVTLGNAYYNRPGVVYHLERKDGLGPLLERAVAYPVPAADIRAFLYNFIFDYLYPGHFQDRDLQSGNKIARDVFTSIAVSKEGGAG